MHPVFEQLQREIGESLKGLDAAQTQFRPVNSSEKWSIQQVMEHLLLTYTYSFQAFEARIERGVPTKAKPNVPMRAVQFVVLTVGFMPKGRKAPVMVTPPMCGALLSGDALVLQADEALIRLDELADKAEGLFGRQRSISHQVLGPLNVTQWRRFQLVHGEHHLKQIRAIRLAHGV